MVGGVLTFLSTILVSVIVCIAIGWKFALVCSATIPVVALCGWIRLQMLAVFDSKIRQSRQESAAYASEVVAAIRIVASCGLESHVLKTYDSILAKQTADSVRSILLTSLLYAASQSATFLCAALGFWYGGTLIANGEYTIFQFFICFVALISGSQIAGAIFSYAPDASKAMHASLELKRLFELQPKIDTDPDHRECTQREPLAGQIDFENVSFRYPSRPDRLALDGLSLSIHPGQYVALVGPSGCGKSTVLALLERFYDADDGRVLIDGGDVSRFDIHAYRRQLSFVGQEPTLYSGDIRENLTMGLSDVSEEEVINACRQANINDFVLSLP